MAGCCAASRFSIHSVGPKYKTGEALMAGIGGINLKVAVIDSDFYSRNAINAYLAWDRRTRVIMKTDSLQTMWQGLAGLPSDDLPDVAVLDADHLDGEYALRHEISRLRQEIDQLMVVCLAQFSNLNFILASAESGARAYLLKQDVRLHIAGAICYALHHDFVVSQRLTRAVHQLTHQRVVAASILPGPRQYPGMTDRIRQTIELYAIEGMPTRLIADEMGISRNTVQGYINEAYRILETQDSGAYPDDMSRQELAFMRITALEDEHNRQE